MPAPDALCLVRTTLDDEAKADQFARRLVEEGLTACAHTLRVTSAYKWNGRLVQEPEWLVECRVVPAGVPALRKRILALHPYDVPLIEVLDATGVPPTYVDWAQAASK